MCLTSCKKGQELDTQKLKAELDSIMVTDQKYRKHMTETYRKYGLNSPEMQDLWEKQNRIDSSNTVRIIGIIDAVGGYPGKSLVGVESGKSAFYVLQHSHDSIQDIYYPMIMKAAEEKELSVGLAAMYHDRHQMRHDQPQTYGTQLQSKVMVDSVTGERKEIMVLWPMADTTNIDSLRLWNGLGPLEDYLNGFGVSRWENPDTVSLR